MEIELPEDPDILFLGKYPENVSPYPKDTWSTMFITTLFIIARNKKQSDVSQQKNG